METLMLYAMISTAILVATIVLAVTGLRAFSAWIELKRMELGLRGAPAGAGSRIDIADLKERVRRLEAIAAGVDI